jgi:zinc transport system substrate-binding protein
LKITPFTIVLTGLFLLLAPTPAARAAPDVVVSILPLHSLVSSVMIGIGEPDLLLRGQESPHQAVLKPSQAAALRRAEIIYWIGPSFELFLTDAIENIGQNARSVELLNTDGLQTHAFRHSVVGTDDHSHDNDPNMAIDPHIWLDPLNGQVLLRKIADDLSALDPPNAAAYQANAGSEIARLTGLADDLARKLDLPDPAEFIVFHDAYQYFEHRFGLVALASISVNPEVIPGARRLSQLRQQLTQHPRVCIFSEPQFPQNLVNLVREDTAAISATLDPLGTTIPAGPLLYAELLNNMAATITQCLTQ